MFFISKLILIVLINEIYAYITQNAEIILLPASYPIGAKEIPLTLKIFGQLIQLNLRNKNDRIVSPAFRVWKHINAKSVTEKLLESNVSSHCYYYHEDHISSAIVNFCHEDGLEGLIFVKNDTLEIRPLRNIFTTMCFIDDFREQTNLSFGKPYVIKKSLQYLAYSNLFQRDMFKLKKHLARNAQRNLTIELAIFFDEGAYNKSMFLVEHNEEKLHNMILAYVNRIQTAFNHPSLDVFINITLTKFYILHKYLKIAPFYGDANKRLNLFCKFANFVNFPDDDPRHWDIALLITGENLYKLKNYLTIYKTEENYNIMGKTFQDGACVPHLSCAIVKFCDPSEIVFLDVIYTIGSLLGLTQRQSSSDLDGYITWSEDSRNKMKNLWERKICLTDQAKTKNIDDDNTQKKLTIELAVFFDEAAYRMYMPILHNNEKRLRNMILAYVNQIQAFFHHSSVGIPIDISLVQLIIMDKQPLNLPVFDGDSEKLILSFCKYALTNNSHYWDIGLYLTGIDLYLIEDGQKNYNVLGLSSFNTVCSFSIYSCAIVEFGTIGENTTISAFSTSSTAAYQIGRMLGIPLDSIDSKCSKGKYIMTDWSFLRGYTTWSECSRNVTKNLWKTKSCLRDHTKQKNANALDHMRYNDLPGRNWTAQIQCKLFLRDKDANVVTLHDICQVLQCETPHKDKYFFARPALDGTYCALGKECRGGECVSVSEPPNILPYFAHNNWSEWKENSCKSNCLNMSKGVIIKRRFCVSNINKKRNNCYGPYYDMDLCDDSSLCTEKRKLIDEYANIKCKDFNSKMKIRKEYFNKLVDEPAHQAIHDVKKPWTACTIYCQQKENTSTNSRSYSWITPRLEMLDFGIDPYFPDGTWCHEKDGQNYYCRQHYCVPENYSNEDVRRIIESFSTYVDKELEENKIAKYA